MLLSVIFWNGLYILVILYKQSKDNKKPNQKTQSNLIPLNFAILYNQFSLLALLYIAGL